MSEKEWRALLGGKGAGPGAAKDDQAWNILVQILLPLVFILTFVVLTSIQAYRERAKAMEDLLREEGTLTSLKLREAVLDLQLQKLLKALEEEKEGVRTALRIPLFPSPERVQRKGLTPDDIAFGKLCTDSLKIFEARRAFLDGLYQRVLERAGVADLHPVPVRRWPDAEASETDLVVEGGDAADHRIAASSRRWVHHHILDFLDGLEGELVKLQVGVVGATFEALLEGGGELDRDLGEDSSELLARLANPLLPEAERERQATALYRLLVGRWRATFEGAGYEFLPATWKSIEG